MQSQKPVNPTKFNQKIYIISAMKRNMSQKRVQVDPMGLYRQIDRQIDRKIDRKIDRQIGRKIDRQNIEQETMCLK